MPSSKKSSRRERRQGPAQQVARRRAADFVFGGTRKGLRAALDTLARAGADVSSKWRDLLRRLGPSRDEFVALLRLGFHAHSRQIKASDYEALALNVRRLGEEFASRGVPEEDAISALALHLEACLDQLVEERREQVLALARLTGAMQGFVLRGYAKGRRDGWHTADDQERMKLSRDLHDEIGADLVVLKLYIEMISMELSHGHLDQVEDKLNQAMSLVGRTIESVRRLTLDLGPAVLEQIGFVSAVRLYTRQFSERTGIAIQLQTEGLPASIPVNHETALYRVLQGALSNVAKHASAGKVQVNLGGFRDAVVVMIVEDDGVGFDVLRARPGFGLASMRERIQSLGGRVHVGPGRRAGTRLEVDLPLSGSEEP